VLRNFARGRAIVTPDHARHRDPAHWLELIASENVTVWNSVPALMQILLDYSETAADALRLALLSGDWIPVGLAGRLCCSPRGPKVISQGGATEASIWSI